ncbi:betaine/proline/choline family ABC transporter ATP-binding protein [Desulfosporosinus sp. PR]|uniref:ABC transporter ATP-binding protein n=1 Tax=Candidatus Desulfosporosinus nitrosoreducens TaxID=3401928 RepID=UPI0027F8366F|nr:betaine/proline/choline family ABC transporter ATP-binding protein [Desulfosporosinus sp. PR]MDQ7096404.1 betaine/proline/choline family ABC transporter ATP-binding protein [Desulfosporosinus sp. PR]
MIRFKGITKVYADGFQAIDNLNLNIEKGELFVLIGPSGCGKTTTMKMINRLIEPTTGEIWIENQNIEALDPVELRRNIGYVIQHIGLLPHMTIGENVALVPKLKKWNKEKYLRRVDELLDLVGLDPKVYRNRYPAELSGGQQQRVGVIRAMAAEPPIILMDEPFSALDPISREQLQDELIRLQQNIKKTIVFVTHDMDEALKIADKICIMHTGRIVQQAEPEYILRHPANEFVQSFIGEKRLDQAGILPELNEVMAKAITAGPNRGLAAAVKIMQTHKVDSLLIVDDSKLLGSVGIWEIQQNFQKENLVLKDIMLTETPRIEQGKPLTEAIELMSRHAVSYLPVITENNDLTGVVTRASLVDVMAHRYAKNDSQGGR